MYNKKLHSETFCCARFCAFRVAPFFHKAPSAKFSGELDVRVNLAGIIELEITYINTTFDDADALVEIRISAMKKAR